MNAFHLRTTLTFIKFVGDFHKIVFYIYEDNHTIPLVFSPSSISPVGQQFLMRYNFTIQMTLSYKLHFVTISFNVLLQEWKAVTSSN